MANKEHQLWKDIKKRCYSKNNYSYKYYGGKGIEIYNEWKESFENFRDWSNNNGYAEELVIDKDTICERDNIFPKIYSPSTCIWMTVSENTLECNNRMARLKSYKK